MSQYRKKHNFIDAISNLKKTKSTGPAPERPNLSIFSEIFYWDDKIKSPYLVLDEVNAVKNTDSITFAAVLELRELCNTCLMLSGSPIDNIWLDVFSFLQFAQGHNIREKQKMLQLLGTPDQKYPRRFKAPSGQRFLRFLQILNSFIVRWPESMLNLPPLEEHTVRFSLDYFKEGMSNEAFEKYTIGMRISRSECKSKGKEQGGRLKSLTHALQHAYHPKMVELMEEIRFSQQKLGSMTSEAADVLHDVDAIAKWTEWREMLKSDNNWHSSRILALIDAFNKQRDLDPSCSVIVFDESVYFLDIVQIAFAAMYEPVECLRYDGRETPIKRGNILTEFEEADGYKVLLISRAASSLGLDIVCANVVILCGPWWKREWEEQAMKCVYRPGQKRPITCVRLFAEDCDAEHYKAKIRDRKHEFNTKAMQAITRGDDQEPEVWDNFV
jgi:SNF2 family DNA or RNA helicase